MVRYKCAVTGCASSSETGGLSFHSFPTADDRRKMWLEALGCGSSGSTLARRVCSLHFDERAFTRVGSETQRGMKRRRLCPDAVPKGSASAAGVGRAITEERTGTDAAMLVCPMEASWTVEHNPSALTNTSDNSIHFVESDFAIGCNAEVGTDTGACGDMSLTHLTAGCKVQLGENSEVRSSNAMEKFGLKKGLGELKDQNVTICSLTTDRHVGIKKYMRTCEPGIEHTYDAWHVGKGVKKKLTVAAKKSACAALKDWIQPVVNHLYWCVAVSEGDGDLLVAMWKSMLNHVINMHAGHDSPYPRCLHGDVQNGKWLTPGHSWLLFTTTKMQVESRQ
ncbi:hypothetical protein HPB52_015608 [Rhipicephalus sanguineus]|uniref:THAP-type domain-containing protein n=1 Tax=Rhipicephalus sanguineus TaxID=34632 RepID=A0A9D4PP20_RHISA|nr:hypothetical protein HPB52_015608 [Rhipicephalus sanguineus]